MTFDKEMEIIERTLDLEMLRADRDFKYEMSMAVLTDQMDVFCFVESEDGSGAKNIFSRIIDAIIQFVRDLTNSISNIFAKDEGIDMESYAQSKTGKMTLAYDIQNMEKEVDQRILEGRKIVQAISSTTGISDAKVAAFADKCKGVVQKYGGYVVAMAGLTAVRRYVGTHFMKDKEEKLSALKNVCSEAEARFKSIPYIRRKNKEYTANAAAAKAAQNAGNAAKKQRQIKTVLNAITGMVHSAGSAGAAVAKQLHNLRHK